MTLKLTKQLIGRALTDRQNVLLVAESINFIVKCLYYNFITHNYKVVTIGKGKENILYEGKSPTDACTYFNQAT